MNPTQDEIADVLEQCAEAEDHESKYPGMSYEQGVAAATQ